MSKPAVVVVTGASGGIGRAVARAYGRQGEYWRGASTTTMLLANAVVPALLDRYLGRKGFDSQQTDQPRQPAAPTNLWEPADAGSDFGAHGRFDDESTSRSLQLWASQHHGLTAMTGATAAVAVAAARGSRSGRAEGE